VSFYNTKEIAYLLLARVNMRLISDIANEIKVYETRGSRKYGRELSEERGLEGQA
jgi:hypothetical protein